jgi:hypothetical protein
MDKSDKTKTLSNVPSQLHLPLSQGPHMEHLLRLAFLGDAYCFPPHRVGNETTPEKKEDTPTQSVKPFESSDPVSFVKKCALDCDHWSKQLCNGPNANL